MARAKQLPSGSWRVLLYTGTDITGKRTYESFTAATKAEAELLANQRKVELEHGKEIRKTPLDTTVSDALKSYIELRSSVLAPKTIREYEKMRRLYCQGIMHVKLRNLTSAMLQAEINREASRLSPKTIRNFMGLFIPAVSDLCNKTFKVVLPQPKKHEIVVPEDDMMLRIFEAAKGRKVEIPVLLAATCGLRRGEISALDLDKDIDYKNCTVTVNKDITNNLENEWVTKQPKTLSSYRTVPVPSWVIAIIKEARNNGYEFQKPYAIGNAFARLTAGLGIHVRFHDLRHYYASTMLKLGVPDVYAMRRMGHSTTNMLKTVYQHIMQDKDAEVTDTINEHFEAMQHKMQHDDK